MLRVIEPELMLDTHQAEAYAGADFSASDERFVQRFVELFGAQINGPIVDLGCGPGNIALRMASVYPDNLVIGVEGAPAMLDIARARAAELSSSRLEFLQEILPSDALVGLHCGAVVSNSLLHHLHDPSVLWHSLKQLAASGAPVLIVDLRRPSSPAAATVIVNTYAGSAPEILREDFYHSLLAAFEVDEVKQQLIAAGLDSLTVKSVDDRYLEVSGFMPG